MIFNGIYLMTESGREEFATPFLWLIFNIVY